MNWKIEKLLAGETIIGKWKGNSMLPLIKSGQPVKVSPTNLESLEVGDIVYCKVSGREYLHLVSAKCNKRGVQISSNKGTVNGWTKTVYGKVVEIL